jgi:hypothetical protein
VSGVEVFANAVFMLETFCAELVAQSCVACEISVVVMWMVSVMVRVIFVVVTRVVLAIDFYV